MIAAPAKANSTPRGSRAAKSGARASIKPAKADHHTGHAESRPSPAPSKGATTATATGQVKNNSAAKLTGINATEAR